MVHPQQRDYSYVQAVEDLRAFLVELAGYNPPVLSPMLHDHFVGQLGEIWIRAATLHNDLTPEQPVELEVPPLLTVQHPEPFQELARISTVLSERFGAVKTNLYMTQSPTDEQLIAERVDAIENLIESVIYAIDGAEQAVSPMAIPNFW